MITFFLCKWPRNPKFSVGLAWGESHSALAQHKVTLNQCEKSSANAAERLYHHGESMLKEVPLMGSQCWKDFPSWWVNAESNSPHGKCMLKNFPHGESMLKGIPLMASQCSKEFPSWRVYAERNSLDDESMMKRIPFMVSQCRMTFLSCSWIMLNGKSIHILIMKTISESFKKCFYK
jgi:hypothetical protein